MNNARRKQLNKAEDLLEEAKGIIDECLSDEQDYLDNMPENLQCSEKHDIVEFAIGCMESAIDSIDSAINEIDSAQE